MSISSEISRIKTNVSNAYTALSEKGATMPSVLNTANLKSTIESIETMVAEAMSIETIRRICYVPSDFELNYTQLSYIESTPATYTAGQRIDTGFTPNQNTRVVCDFQFTKTTSSFQALLGSRSSSGNRFCLWLTNGGLFRSDYNTSNLSFPSSLSATGRYTLDFNKNVCTVSNGSVSQTVQHSAGTFNGVCSLYLFASDTGGSADIHGNVRIYSCQIYDNGTLVRDFVPCYRKSSYEVGLYDMVNKRFYTNAGTGAFSSDAGVDFTVSVTDSANAASTLLSTVGGLTVAGQKITSTPTSLVTLSPEVTVTYTLSSNISTPRTVVVNGTTLGTVRTAGNTVSTTVNVADGDTITVAFKT